jgi:hypothetical protein
MQAPLWMGSSRIKQAQGWHELTIGDGTVSLHIGEQKSRDCNWMVADATVSSVHSLTPALMYCLHCCHDQSLIRASISCLSIVLLIELCMRQVAK